MQIGKWVKSLPIDQQLCFFYRNLIDGCCIKKCTLQFLSYLLSLIISHFYIVSCLSDLRKKIIHICASQFFSQKVKWTFHHVCMSNYYPNSSLLLQLTQQNKIQKNFATYINLLYEREEKNPFTIFFCKSSFSFFSILFD